MFYKLKGIAEPIAFDATEDLIPILESVLSGWSGRTVERGGKAKGEGIRLSLGSQGYERRSPWVPSGTAMVLADPVDAVCDLLLDVKRAYVENAAKGGADVLSILHAAAVEMGQGADRGLVVFPATNATGKSLLSVALAAQGHRVFADDQILIKPGKGRHPTQGVAPGFQPRLRLPLPDGLDTALKTFIDARQGAQSAKFLYVNLDETSLAPLGTQARIKGIVLLNRQAGAPPKRETPSEAQVLKSCVLQSFGRAKGGLAVLDQLHAMVKGATCVELTYAETGQAVALLEETFA